jgi:hypothetical protein
VLFGLASVKQEGENQLPDAIYQPPTAIPCVSSPWGLFLRFPARRERADFLPLEIERAIEHPELAAVIAAADRR